MEFERSEEKRLLGGTQVNVKLTHGAEIVNGVRAHQAARALAVAGSEWTRPIYEPNLDEEAVSAVEAWLKTLSQETALSTEIRNDIASAREHIRRLKDRQTLAAELFDADLSSVMVVQGIIGTCYFLAPNVTLHQRPELLWALLPEIFEKMGPDAFCVRFPSMKNVFGPHYPNERELRNFSQEVRVWRSDYKGQGKPGDIALERAYASVIAKGKLGASNMTRRADHRGRLPVERGLANEALASLIPTEWLDKHDHTLLQDVPYEVFLHRIRDPRQLTYFSMDTYDDGVTRKVSVDGQMLFKGHAYGIGELNGSKVRLHNPHNPHKEIVVDAEELYAAEDARLLRAELNYRATPLMDHARMIRGLPSRNYQVNFLRNLMATHYAQLEKLLGLPNTRDALLLGGTEFIADSEFGELFEMANLNEFLTARANGHPSPYSPFTLNESTGAPRLPLYAGAIMGFGAVSAPVLIAGALIVLLQGTKKPSLPPAESVTCPPSVAGNWEHIGGSDVLEGDPYRTRVALTVAVKQEGPDHPAVTVTNYPLACLEGHAPYSVAAQMPVMNDTVVLTDPHSKGTYHFIPSLEPHELATIKRVSSVKKPLVGERDGWTLTCNADSKHPATQACVDEVARWNTSGKK